MIFLDVTGQFMCVFGTTLCVFGTMLCIMQAYVNSVCRYKLKQGWIEFSGPIILGLGVVCWVIAKLIPTMILY